MPNRKFNEPFVLYQIELAALKLLLANGEELDFTFALTTGRANYIMFQALVGHYSGLIGNSEGGKADLCDQGGKTYEVKSYRDIMLHPGAKNDKFHTAASSTFGPNNHGPEINKLLKAGRYEEALAICDAAGYAHNDYYVYTNTSQYGLGALFQYFIVPVSHVRSLLSPDDPRLVSRRDLLSSIKTTIKIA
jgi:hypothetical protein